jgi:hypothetical protein
MLFTLLSNARNMKEGYEGIDMDFATEMVLGIVFCAACDYGSTLSDSGTGDDFSANCSLCIVDSCYSHMDCC